MMIIQFILRVTALALLALAGATTAGTEYRTSSDTSQVDRDNHSRFFDWGQINDTGKFYFRGRMAPECATFVVFETGIYYRLNGHSSELAPIRIDRVLFDWELGFMRNRSERTAYGMTARVSYYEPYESSQIALIARYRRWLSPDIRLDFGLGPAFANYAQHKYALVGNAALNLADWVAITSRIDIAERSDGSGLDFALYGGLNACSYGGLIALGIEAMIGGLLYLTFSDWGNGGWFGSS